MTLLPAEDYGEAGSDKCSLLSFCFGTTSRKRSIAATEDSVVITPLLRCTLPRPAIPRQTMCIRCRQCPRWILLAQRDRQLIRIVRVGQMCPRDQHQIHAATRARVVRSPGGAARGGLWRSRDRHAVADPPRRMAVVGAGAVVGGAVAGRAEVPAPPSLIYCLPEHCTMAPPNAVAKSSGTLPSLISAMPLSP